MGPSRTLWGGALPCPSHSAVQPHCKHPLEVEPGLQTQCLWAPSRCLFREAPAQPPPAWQRPRLPGRQLQRELSSWDAASLQPLVGWIQSPCLFSPGAGLWAFNQSRPQGIRFEMRSKHLPRFGLGAEGRKVCLRSGQEEPLPSSLRG